MRGAVAKGKPAPVSQELKWLNRCVEMDSTKLIVPDTRGGSSAIAGDVTRLNSVRWVDIDAVTNRNV